MCTSSANDTQGYASADTNTHQQKGDGRHTKRAAYTHITNSPITLMLCRTADIQPGRISSGSTVQTQRRFHKREQLKQGRQT